ncbi:hypothetical protein [Sphingomonas lacusdianchii]|uniref:hypothetical protein n=1 Tax=Sphingomonas lacusdianchii TaxID=2917992 RepID=UPI001F55FB41|nr:hypothetical protein [Sphingomonas sp. JXJ CY 53]
MTDTPSAPAVIDGVTTSFRGKFLLYRKAGGKVVKPGHKSTSHNPRFRHPTFASAETEANRLLPSHPESTFIIMQEVGTVKAGDRKDAADQPRGQSDGA